MMLNDCPFGATTCPKIEELEDRVAMFQNEVQELRRTQMEMQRLLYVIVGVVTVSLGVNLGGIL